MKAAVMREIGRPMLVEDVDVAKPGPHEVLVRTVAAGVCHSDLAVLEGVLPLPLPAVLGHESAGIVEAIGSDVRTVRVGDHVVTSPSVYCGHCGHCLTGRPALCIAPELKRGADEESRLSLAGRPVTTFFNLSSFAEMLLVHEHAVVAIRRDMPLDRAAVVGCAVATGYGAVVNTARVQPGQTVAVLGCGGVGLSAINGAAIAGAGRIIAIDRVADKRAMALAFGATDFVLAGETDPVEAVKELTRGGVDHAIECIGGTAAAAQAFAMLGRGGCCTITGLFAPGEEIRIPGNAMIEEKRLIGSRLGSNRFPVDMPRLVDFYLQGRLKLDDLISRRIRLDQINEGFADMKTGKLARSIVVFD